MRIYFDENCALVASSDAFLPMFRDNLLVLFPGFKNKKMTHILMVVLDRLHTHVNGLWRFNVKFLNQTTYKY
jgi:hypothetical protein